MLTSSIKDLLKYNKARLCDILDQNLITKSSFFVAASIPGSLYLYKGGHTIELAAYNSFTYQIPVLFMGLDEKIKRTSNYPAYRRERIVTVNDFVVSMVEKIIKDWPEVC